MAAVHAAPVLPGLRFHGRGFSFILSKLDRQVAER
jgi:hypothetical protein